MLILKIKIMKKVSSIILLFSVILFSFISCDNDDDDVTELTLLTLTSGDVDLYGATVAVNVPVDQPIVAVFSTSIDEATVANAITLTKGGSDVDFTTSVDGETLTITVTGGLITGTNYSLGISAALKSTQGAIFEAATVTFTTMGVGIDTPPQSNNQVLYLQFDNSIVDIVGGHTDAYSEVTYSEDRYGNTNGAASFNGTGNVVEIEYNNDLIPQDITVSFWMKVEPLDREGTEGVPRAIFGLGANNGYFVEYFNFSWGDPLTWVEGLKFVTNHINEGTNVSEYGNNWDEYKGEGEPDGNYTLTNVQGSVSEMIDSKWVHMVFAYNSST
ncbi:MAG TPA: Ig-like domain-containing protein, partial [Massilibacterium sp.]|nr:Ig-like domain-containing protein [Massilibacterium sp.]